MSRSTENTPFLCEHCGRHVLPLTNGSFRNHCPFCLYSKHIDSFPGDRRSDCDGLMMPIGVRYNSHKGYQIVHRCLRCGEVRVNRVASDTEQPDDFELITQLEML